MLILDGLCCHGGRRVQNLHNCDLVTLSTCDGAQMDGKGNAPGTSTKRIAVDVAPCATTEGSADVSKRERQRSGHERQVRRG